jgi:16S rRNA (uracil1498-N3)-methyltransferase
MATPKRLYVQGVLRPGEHLALEGERARYVARVLRLRAGDELLVFDGKGGEHRAILTRASRAEVVLRIAEACDRNVESPLSVHLVQGISRGERMDTVVQKATELGVHRITPLVTERSVVRLDDDRAARRTEHWRKVARSACEQCGRNVLPEIDVPQELDRFIDNAAAGEMLRVLLHAAAGKTLMSLSPPAARVQVLVGPEGGLSAAERERTLAAGFAACSLGPRILRTETAALAAIALLQARLGDLA